MTPEGYIWAYDTAREAGAPSFDVVKSTGYVYAAKCGAELPAPKLSRRARLAGKKARRKLCASTARQWSYAERQWVCGYCGSPWRFWERRSLRGEVQESRSTSSDQAERRLARTVDVGLALQRFEDRWGTSARVYVAHARGASLWLLATTGAAGHFGPASWTWNRTTVARLIQAAGREWRAILTEAGLPFEG